MIVAEGIYQLEMHVMDVQTKLVTVETAMSFSRDVLEEKTVIRAVKDMFEVTWWIKYIPMEQFKGACFINESSYQKEIDNGCQ